MRLEQFEYFIEIANSKSISIAAENLFISQPALSRSIKALEEELGVTLFYRTVDGMRLTKAGQELYPEMKEIIDRTIALSKHAASFAKTCPDEDFEGPFHIYTLPVLIDSLLMPTLEQLHHDYPDLDPHMHQLDLGEPLSLKIPEDADMILSVNVGNILDQDIADSGWHLEQLFIGNSFLVVSKHHPLAGKKITRHEVLEQKLITHLNGFHVELLYQELAQQRPDIVLKSNNTRVITQTLMNNQSALLTNNLLLQMDYSDNPDLVVIPIKNSRTQYFCLYDDNHPYRCFIDDFVETFKFVRNNL